MSEPMKSLGTRLEGTIRQIEEMLRRLRHVADFEEPSNRQWRDSDHPEVKFCYLRCYFYEPDTLLDQLEAAMKDIKQLEEEIECLKQENSRLKEALDQQPKPKQYDVVLGNHLRRPN